MQLCTILINHCTGAVFRRKFEIISYISAYDSDYSHGHRVGYTLLLFCPPVELLCSWVILLYTLYIVILYYLLQFQLLLVILVAQFYASITQLERCWMHYELQLYYLFVSAQCVHRTNRRAIAMMFAHLSVSPSLRLSGRACIVIMHFNADLSLWLHCLMFWAPWYQSMSTYSRPSFSSSTCTWCKLGLHVNTNIDK